MLGCSRPAVAQHLRRLSQPLVQLGYLSHSLERLLCNSTSCTASGVYSTSAACTQGSTTALQQSLLVASWFGANHRYSNAQKPQVYVLACKYDWSHASLTMSQAVSYWGRQLMDCNPMLERCKCIHRNTSLLKSINQMMIGIVGHNTEHS